MAEGCLAQFAESVLDDLCERFPMGYRPSIIWKSYRVTAGMAYYRTGIIGLSNRVLTDEERVRDTVRHEYAHLLAVHRHGVRAAGHGPAWQQAMLDVGMTPTVRHRYEVERNQKRQRVVYRCRKCGHEIGVARRFPRRRIYLHVACGGRFDLLRVEAVTQTPPVS